MSTGALAEMADLRETTTRSASVVRRALQPLVKARRLLGALFSSALVLAIAVPVGVLAGLGLSAGSATPVFADEPLINGGGSSYAAVAINQWAGEAKVRYGMNINYAVSSSVQGLNEFALGQLNFGASEIGYSTKQADYAAPPGFQYLPDVAGATCLDYHLTAVNGRPVKVLLLNPTVMAEIFTGQIKYWNDSAIKALNPHLLLPHEPIVVAWREDPSGDNYLFSQYLNAVAPSIWEPFDRSLGYYANDNYATAIWPQPNGQKIPDQYNLAGWVGESGSDNASYYVASTQGAITYVETAYALEHGDPCAYIRNQSGHYVEPTEYNDAVALTKAQLLPDLEQELGEVYTNPDPDAYPISAYSYLLTKESGYSEQMANELGKFIQFLACYGQQSAGTLGYSPLPPILVQRDFQAVNRIVGASKAPAAPTPSNCSDPYVNGTLPFPGGPHVDGSGGGGTTTPTKPTGTTATTTTTVPKVTATTTPTGKSGKPSGTTKTGTKTGTKTATKTGSPSGTKSAGSAPTGPASGVISSPGAAQQGGAASNDGLALLDSTNALTRSTGPDAARDAVLLAVAAVVLFGPLLFVSWRQRRRRRAA